MSRPYGALASANRLNVWRNWVANYHPETSACLPVTRSVARRDARNLRWMADKAGGAWLDRPTALLMALRIEKVLDGGRLNCMPCAQCSENAVWADGLCDGHHAKAVMASFPRLYTEAGR